MKMKKVIKKKVSKKVTKKKRARVPTRSEKMEKILIENFVSLQKVMTNLSEKFDKLAKQSSELLNLFEESARIVIKRDFQLPKDGGDKKDIKEVESKLNTLLEQNKIIAKGLTLIHETAKNPKINYSIGTNPKIPEPSKTMTPSPISKISPAVQVDSKKLVREDPSIPKF